MAVGVPRPAPRPQRLLTLNPLTFDSLHISSIAISNPSPSLLKFPFPLHAFYPASQNLLWHRNRYATTLFGHDKHDLQIAVQETRYWTTLTDALKHQEKNYPLLKSDVLDELQHGLD